jgi:hypothetical protein
LAPVDGFWATKNRHQHTLRAASQAPTGCQNAVSVTAFQRMKNGITPTGVTVGYSDLAVVQGNDHWVLFKKWTVITNAIYSFVSTIGKNTTYF